jgi:hypothetical protein
MLLMNTNDEKMMKKEQTVYDLQTVGPLGGNLWAAKRANREALQHRDGTATFVGIMCF